ncbi:MAG: tyrosine-type recombinase/integrase [Cyclobacteriaceae bacterium]
MATCTLFHDTRNKNTDSFPIVLRISHKGNRKDIPTAYKVSKSDWNDNKKLIKGTYPNSSRANSRLKNKIAIATEVISEYGFVLKNMTVVQLASAIKEHLDEAEKEKLPPLTVLPTKSHRTTLKDYSEKVIARYEKAKRFGMANSFKDSVKVFLRFHGNDQLVISDIDETFLEELEADYVGSGNKINGLGVSLRGIRRIFNLSIKDKETEIDANDYPFGRGGYSIKREKSQKRAVKLDVIQAIRDLKLEEGSASWHHRNYFMFMFNMRGMNFIDMAFLRKDAIKDSRIRYKRRKTKRGNSVKEFDIKITDDAQRIIDCYSQRNNKSDLVFPIMEDVINSGDDQKIYALYQNRLRNHNRRLNTIGKAIGLDTKLTTYVARHTFATAGLHKGVSKAQIGDMLGHTSYYTTEAYFDDFDKEVLDDAADQILG